MKAVTKFVTGISTIAALAMIMSLASCKSTGKKGNSKLDAPANVEAVSGKTKVKFVIPASVIISGQSEETSYYLESDSDDNTKMKYYQAGNSNEAQELTYNPEEKILSTSWDSSVEGNTWLWTFAKTDNEYFLAHPTTVLKKADSSSGLFGTWTSDENYVKAEFNGDGTALVKVGQAMTVNGTYTNDNGFLYVATEEEPSKIGVLLYDGKVIYVNVIVAE